MASDRAQLVDGIESYLSVQAFMPELKKRALTFVVEYPRPAPEKDNRPPFEITLVKVDRYSHLEFVGQLHNLFFNDRLESVRFYPPDVDGYLERLRAETGIDLTKQTEARPYKHTRVWSATEHTGKHYVGWEDVRLSEEMALWIRRYS